MTYSITANCNYESADADGRQIHAARLAAEAGLTDDPALLDALDALEDVLGRYACDSRPVAVAACERAEAAVLATWTDRVQDAADAVRESRYHD